MSSYKTCAPRVPWGVVILALCCVSSCAYPVRNHPATVISDTHGYQFAKLERRGGDDTLVIVTMSGGGTRATALGLSVLQGLDGIALPSGETLAEEINVVSSVSGGSVTAAYFALSGRDGFKRLKDDFIDKDGMTPLVVGFLNPFGLVLVSTPEYERIDLLIDYLNQQLFDNKTYQTLIDQKRMPFLVLNAADMVEGVPFPFTQRKMDLLCSDLSKMPLATAVAASAAFPVALSPVTLKNYSPCAAQKNRWPPAWVSVNIDKPGTAQADSLWYDNPSRATLGRTEYAYALGADPTRKQPKLYIHLLDGGIADNLGVFEPFRMLTTRDTLPTFLGQIDTGAIKKLIFVMVNARSFAPSKLDVTQATPGSFDMLLASISSPIDRATTGTASQLRQLLFDEFRQLALADPRKEEIYHALAMNTAVISVDFDAIVEEDCRRKFQSIPTTWALDAQQIKAVLQVGGALLGSDPEFPHLLEITGGALKENLPSVEDACKIL